MNLTYSENKKAHIELINTYDLRNKSNNNKREFIMTTNKNFNVNEEINLEEAANLMKLYTETVCEALSYQGEVNPVALSKLVLEATTGVRSCTDFITNHIGNLTDTTILTNTRIPNHSNVIKSD